MQHSTTVARELRSAAPDAGSGQHSSTSEASRLIAAVVSSDLTGLRVLIDEGVSPDTTWYGRTAVVWAVLHGRFDSLELLLDAGASPEALTPSGKSPLEIARSLSCRRRWGQVGKMKNSVCLGTDGYFIRTTFPPAKPELEGPTFSCKFFIFPT